MRRNKPTAHILTANEKDEQIRRVALYRALTANVLTSRMSYGNTTTFGGLRDVYTALGYPGLDGIKYADYYFRFRRQDIAAKIIEKPVDASWRRLPIIHSDGAKSDNDPFKDAWEAIQKRLGIYNVLMRADKVTGIGRYGVLLLGFNDKPASLAEEVTKASDLLFIQPFSEDNAPIKTYDTDKNSPRFGMPLTYGLRIANTPGTVSTLETVVHHSRVIHITEGLTESNVLGMPRLERVWNRLLNMELIVGGSAEMFWQGAFPGLAFKADPDVNVELDKEALEAEIKKYTHNLERYMKLQGIDVQNLAPAVADPTAHADIQLKIISIATGIPKRIFEGSERGELSSSQDTEAWDDLMDGRRMNHNEPVILRPLIDRLISKGVLKGAVDGYNIEWPDLSAPSDKDKAETGRIRSEALAKYLSSPDAQLIMPLKAFLAEIMDIGEEKVERIMLMVDDIMSKARALVPDGQGDDELIEDEGSETQAR